MFPHSDKVTHERSAQKVKRFESLKRRQARQALFQYEPAAKVHAPSVDDTTESAPGMSTEMNDSERSMFITETSHLRSERDNALQKCKLYEDKMVALKSSAASVAENDSKCQFYMDLAGKHFSKHFNV